MYILLALIAVLVFIDFYAFKALKIAFARKSVKVQRTARYFYWSFSVILVVLIGIQLIPFQNNVWRTLLRSISISVAAINYFSKLLLLLFVLLDDLKRAGVWMSRRFVQHKKKQEQSGKISRSEFLAKSGMVVATAPFAAVGWGISSGAYDYRIIHQRIPFKNLPSAFHGIKIAQISDIHSGSFFNKTAVKGGVDMLLAEKPDMVFFTGDLVNEQTDEVHEYFDIFSKVSAPLGVYSVLGNHDYGDYKKWGSIQEKKANMDLMYEAHKQLGWHLLRNENKKITLPGGAINLIGVENWGKGRFAKYGDLSLAHTGVKGEEFSILLSHDPSHWDAQVRPMFKDIDLMLAGHTHGAQFGIETKNIKWSPSQYMYKQWAGLYKEENQYLYVNRGYGFLGFPGRIGMSPEITILELVKV